MTLQVAKALRLELKKSDNDVSSVLVQAQRRVAGAVLSARAISQLAMGNLWLAMLDAEAAMDCSPESSMTHVRMGEVYEEPPGEAPPPCDVSNAPPRSPPTRTPSRSVWRRRAERLGDDTDCRGRGCSARGIQSVERLRREPGEDGRRVGVDGTRAHQTPRVVRLSPQGVSARRVARGDGRRRE